MPCLTAYVDHLYDYHITATIEPQERVNIEVERDGLGISCEAEDISYRLTAEVGKVNESLNVAIANEECAKHGGLKMKAARSTSPMVVTFGIVCTRSEIALLEVSPEDVQWITLDMGVVYEVTSKVSWTIEY